MAGVHLLLLCSVLVLVAVSEVMSYDQPVLPRPPLAEPHPAPQAAPKPAAKPGFHFPQWHMPQWHMPHWHLPPKARQNLEKLKACVHQQLVQLPGGLGDLMKDCVDNMTGVGVFAACVASRGIMDAARATSHVAACMHV